ncbi:MAG: hypothetical protein ACR2NZ_12845 [Rubripirellula sp.]
MPPEEEQPASTSQRGDAVQQDSNARQSLTRRTFKDRRRQSLLIFAFAGTLAVVGGLWWQGFFEVIRSTQTPTVPASVRFDELCEQVRQGRSDKFHANFEVDDALVLTRLGEMDWIETLILDQGSVGDRSAEVIATLPNLQHLRLRLSPIGDEGLRDLSNCKTLWYLNLPHSVCTTKGVESLASLPKLRQLRLGSKYLGNDVTRAIATVPSLRGVHLIGIPVTDEGLKTLAAMPHLESLYLDDSAVTEAGWEWLFREHPHMHVHVNQSHHDRDPKAHPHH